MALTLSQAGTANSTTSNASFSVTLTQSVAIGDMLIVCVAADNAGTAGATSVTTVTDSKSNTYTQRAIQNNDPGAASAGATSAIYTAFVTSAMTTSDTVTINFSPNTQYKSAVVWEAAVASTEYPKYLSNGGTTASTANPSLVSTSVTSGDGIIYALAIESNATLTGDSDTTNGSWAALYTDIGTGGTSNTSMRVGSQNKVVTATATQSWDVTITSADWAMTYIIVSPATKIGRTATGSGTGSASASRTKIKLRTATGSGTGSASAVGVRVKVRTATGSGTGTSTSTFNIIPGFTGQTFQRTATGTGAGTASATASYIRVRTATGSGSGTSTSSGLVRHRYQRTATGSGTGSSTASFKRSRLRTATSTGSGTATATCVKKRARTATGTGAGSSSAAFIRVPCRTATGTGTGASTVTEILVAKRTATATGTGTSTVLRRLTALRTATATGAGTSTSSGCKVFRKTATASGIGSSTAQFVKLLIFYTPSTTEIAPADRRDMSVSGRLFKYAEPTLAGVNVYKLVDGTYTEVEQRDYTLVAKTYFGGSKNFVTQAEKDDLIANGYGGYVT